MAPVTDEQREVVERSPAAPSPDGLAADSPLLNCPALARPPAVVDRLLRLAPDLPDAGAAVVRLVSGEPVLLERLLRLANADFWDGGRIVRGVGHAVEIAGAPAVRTLAVGLALAAHSGRSRPAGVDAEAFWRRAVCAAAAARALAPAVRAGATEDLVVAALLMDAGVLVLDRTARERYKAIYEGATTHAGLERAERAELGVTHADASRALAAAWCLDARVVEAIACHHDPEAPTDARTKALARGLALASRAADVLAEPAGGARALADFRRAAAGMPGLDDAGADAVLSTAAARATAMAGAVGLGAAALRDVAAAPARAREALSRYLREAHETGGGGAERRTAPRFERAGVITILRGAARSDAVARPTLARFRDASTGGIGIYLDGPMAVGEEFVVRVPHARGQRMPVVYRVVRCYRAGGAGAKYAIGAQVARVLRDPDAR